MGAYYEIEFFKNEEEGNQDNLKPVNIKSSVNIQKSVKSIYIIKYVFSLLDENKKLNLIIYNKRIQNQLGINLEKYKLRSSRIFHGNKNEIGKEFKLGTNILLFEGNYLNGKKNGNGKEYYENGKLKFEGEYLNGKKIQGKGYNEQGDLILKLYKNGKGEEFYDNGEYQFEGYYLNGRRWHGRGYNYQGYIIY